MARRDAETQSVGCRRHARSAPLSHWASLLIAGLSALAGCGGESSRSPRVTVSQETTRFVSPLRPDGSVDYAAVINGRFGEGVTAENNACVPLAEASRDREFPPSYFEALGMETPDTDGPRLLSIGDFIRQQGRESEDDQSLYYSKNRPWTRDEFPGIADWLDENEAPLRLVRAAAERNVFYTPLTAVAPVDRSHIDLLQDARLPWLQVRLAANLLTTRAMLRVGEGEVSEAWQDVLACIRLGRLAAHAPVDRELHAGYEIEERGQGYAIQLLRDAPLSAAEARQLQRQLDALPELATIETMVDVSERCFLLDQLQNWSRNQLTQGRDDLNLGLQELEQEVFGRFPPSTIDWNEVMRAANAWCDRQVAWLRLPTHAERQAVWQSQTGPGPREKIQALLTHSSRSPGNLATARLIGECFARGLVLASSRFPEDRVRQQADLLHIALTLAAYRADQGEFPQRLHELTPKYLERVPLDLFTQGLLVYRRDGAGYLLYSVGENMRDDHGQPSGGSSGSDDLAVRIP